MALGLLLLTAAALKGHQLATTPVAGGGWLDARWILIAAVECELLFGLWLLSGLLPRLTWAAAGLCFGLFACVSLYKGLSGAATCGCFGRVAVNPWYTFALDIAAVLALLRFPPRRVISLHHSLPSPLSLLPSASNTSRLRPAIVLALFLLLGLPAGWAMATYRAATLDDAEGLLGDGRVVVLEPEKWIGKRFPLLPYIDIGDQLAEGEWIVVLYREGCPKCGAVVEALEATAPGFRPHAAVAVVEIPPFGKRWAVDDSRLRCVWGRLVAERTWLVESGIQLTLADGLVVRVGEEGVL